MVNTGATIPACGARRQEGIGRNKVCGGGKRWRRAWGKRSVRVDVDHAIGWRTHHHGLGRVVHILEGLRERCGHREAHARTALANYTQAHLVFL